MNMEKYRNFLKDTIRQTIDFTMTAQKRGIPVPPIEKECGSGDKKIVLPGQEDWDKMKNMSLYDAILRRKSVRNFAPSSLSLNELSFLLWATQGVRTVINGHAFRTVPSAGCRHALETYLAVFRVETLEKGIYRYLPLEHNLILVREVPCLESEMSEAAMGQRFASESAVTFIWTTIPERMEWRYGEASHKVIALDAGHVCQNLYLSCGAVGAATCAIAAYDQGKADRLAGVDGKEEFVIYMAPVGKRHSKK